MDAIVNLVLATSIWAAVGHSGLPPGINQIEPNSIGDTIAVNANCTKIKCHGDFPISSTRRYAEAKQDGHHREPHGIEGRILVAESKHQESSFVRLGTLAAQAPWKEFTSRATAHRPALDMNHRI